MGVILYPSCAPWALLAPGLLLLCLSLWRSAPMCVQQRITSETVIVYERGGRWGCLHGSHSTPGTHAHMRACTYTSLTCEVEEASWLVGRRAAGSLDLRKRDHDQLVY